jgi:hypothetical protein
MTEPIKRQPTKKNLDEDHGIYRDPGSSGRSRVLWQTPTSPSASALPRMLMDDDVGRVAVNIARLAAL